MSLEMQSKCHTYADTYNYTSNESDNDRVLDSIVVLLLSLNVNPMTSILLERVVTAATSETEAMPCRNRARTMERRRPHQH